MGLLQSKFFRLPKHKNFDFYPRYYDPEEEIKQERLKQAEEQRIKLKRGSFFNSANKSRLVGAFTEKEIVFRDRYEDKGNQLKRILLLILMLSLPLLHLMDYLNGVVTFGLLAILLIIFIMQVNKF